MTLAVNRAVKPQNKQTYDTTKQYKSNGICALKMPGHPPRLIRVFLISMKKGNVRPLTSYHKTKTDWTPRLNWAFDWCTSHFVCFFRVWVQMKTLLSSYLNMLLNKQTRGRKQTKKQMKLHTICIFWNDRKLRVEWNRLKSLFRTRDNQPETIDPPLLWLFTCSIQTRRSMKTIKTQITMRCLLKIYTVCRSSNSFWT